VPTDKHNKMKFKIDGTTIVVYICWRSRVAAAGGGGTGLSMSKLQLL